ncbi:GNAT family N-acetyltransferase [Aquimarina sp. AD10]|uniref:bifunctional helix-turn-helix transcriptional regulator/GNAT family N-acetyltransferase n=1 Tax=Aquimarina TaxID=290174 RepID=UPI000E51B74D|nr:MULTISPECIES: bifunctional helix-turn-helix transcriptional regulator/GNAT family N-acetyltransferase [Aquimarina]AXT60067.1 GNAT family N-acetyltransferase [Aquimarina sp. AD10]RKM96209.1 GNAT family N-acetyltransferase [Aquimarina sp. AD10]
MDFDKIGEMALGSRLRALSTIVSEDAERIYNLYGVALKPKWFPVFYFLSNQNTGKSITAIANEIGHSHPSVIKIVREMSKVGLVLEQKDTLDKRKNNIVLTPKGIDMSIQIQQQYKDVENAVKTTLNQTTHNIWLAIQEFEYLLNEKSLLKRVIEQKKIRESSTVEIIDYTSKYHTAFKELNEEWIKTFFKIEDADRKALDDPQKYILDSGGKILVAIQDQNVLGVCALIKMKNKKYDYELAKMAVSPKAQGKGIGYLLGKSSIEKAKSLGAKSIYLESNTILKPAISLYEKLGFQKVVGIDTPYERCNIQMELLFS